jgi:hypothetical protein
MFDYVRSKFQNTEVFLTLWKVNKTFNFLQIMSHFQSYFEMKSFFNITCAIMSSGTYGAGRVPFIMLLMVAAGRPRIDEVRIMRWPRRCACRTLEAGTNIGIFE